MKCYGSKHLLTSSKWKPFLFLFLITQLPTQPKSCLTPRTSVTLLSLDLTHCSSWNAVWYPFPGSRKAHLVVEHLALFKTGWEIFPQIALVKLCGGSTLQKPLWCHGPRCSLPFSAPPPALCEHALCWQVAKELAINKWAARLQEDSLTDFLGLANLPQRWERLRVWEVANLYRIVCMEI